MSWVAVAVGGSAALGAGLNFMGQSSQAKNSRAAMQNYINYIQGQRDEFLRQPETGAIREKLGSYINGDVGYNPQLLGEMKRGVYEDYGKSLSDMTRLTKASGAGATGVMTPGRADRTSRLLGQNIAANRANAIRDIHTKNADVALNNQRLAVSALPTFMPGVTSTPSAGADVFSAMGNVPNIGSFMGPAVTSAGQSYANLSIYGPILQRMMTQQNTPYMGNTIMMSGYNPGGGPEMTQRLFPTQ